jgi:L-threonylcarbamoyladenylate synthase
MYYNWEKNIIEEELNNIVKLIKNGEIIIFPTETVYGLGGDALNKDASRKI